MTTFALPGPIRLHVRLVHGSVLVHARDEVAEASVVLTPRPGSERLAERITVALNGQVLDVHAPKGIIGIGDRTSTVDAVITVPVGTPLDIGTDTADITLTGSCGASELRTGSGDVRAVEIDGDLRLRCGTSDVSIDTVTGSVHARSGSGDVRLGTVDGAMDVASGSGLLEVDVLRGALRSKCGSVTAVLHAVYGDIDLLSGSGDSTIGLPMGVSARLDVTSGSGTVTCPSTLEEQPPTSGSAITVRARTGSGDVTFVRAA